MLILVINSELMISNILNFRIRYVNGNDYIFIIEEKTGKQKIFKMTLILKRKIKNIVMKNI
ncbi:hypothetical protein [Clostridium perfringens]|uniref:hypothetical protein n=1 Tax=Clostridium perfringens TaxID=1502 RepID=UPI0024BCBEED|nr:hypothetical protein [Clostridium perfringens]MDV5106315.1 hypothetical protein [Clostridium perfringens]